MDAPVPAAAAPADGEHAANAAAAEAAPGPPSGSWPVLPKGFVLAGQYQIQSHLSQGGFGAVYKAVDLLSQNKPKVAIKLEVAHTLPDKTRPVSPDSARRIKAALRGARLQREWEVYSRLGAVAQPGQEPEARRLGVPTVHAVGQVLLEGKAAPLAPAALHHCMWMAMELLGRDLWTARDQGRAFAGPRASEDVAAAGHGALRALQHLHSRGVLHRDIKPENLALPRPTPAAPAAVPAPPLAPAAAAAPAPAAHKGRGKAARGGAEAAAAATLASVPAAAPAGLRGTLQLLPSAVLAVLGGAGVNGGVTGARARREAAAAATAAVGLGVAGGKENRGQGQVKPAAGGAKAAKLAASQVPLLGPPQAAGPSPRAAAALHAPPVFLLDMGLASFMEQDGTVKPRVFYGTKEHSSVNMLRQGRLSAADDLLSLGSTLLELQAGHLPWSGMLDGPQPKGGGGGGARAATTVRAGPGESEEMSSDAGSARGGSEEGEAEEEGRDDSGEFGRRRLDAAARAQERAWALAVRQGRLPPWALAWHVYVTSLQPGDAINYGYLSAILDTLPLAPPRPLQLRPQKPPAPGARGAQRPEAAPAPAPAEGGGGGEAARTGGLFSRDAAPAGAKRVREGPAAAAQAGAAAKRAKGAAAAAAEGQMVQCEE